MHIGYLTHYFYPETGAPAGRAHDLSRRWVALGHRVSVLTTLPNHPEGRIRPDYQRRGVVVESIDGVTVQRQWLYPTAKRTPLGVSLNHGSFALHCVAASLARRVPRPDIWLASSPPLFTGAVGWWLSRVQRVPWVFEVRDLWPDYFVEMGIIRRGLPLKGLYALEMFLYRRASKVVTVAETARTRLIQDKGVDDDKLYCIPNGAELARFAVPEAATKEIRKRLELDGKFVVAYVGNHGLGQRLTTVIDAAAILSGVTDVHFVFVGDGADKEKIVRRAQELKLTNVSFVSTQPREEIPAYYAVADVCVVPLADVPSFRNTIPSKLFEIFACGRPVIGSLSGEGADLIQKAGAGIVVSPERPRELAQAIEWMRALEGPVRLQFGDRALQYVRANFNRADLSERYLRILQSALAEAVSR